MGFTLDADRSQVVCNRNGSTVSGGLQAFFYFFIGLVGWKKNKMGCKSVGFLALFNHAALLNKRNNQICYLAKCKLLSIFINLNLCYGP